MEDGSNRQSTSSDPEGVRVGSPLPWGVRRVGNGVNFSLFSRHATRIRLELYDAPDDPTPARSIPLEAPEHRTGDTWHVWLADVEAGQLYGYRVEGPFRPREGHRFNARKLLIDPYATALVGTADWEFGPALGYDPGSASADLSASDLDDAGSMPRCVVTPDDFDWQGDRPPRHAWTDTVIYETHVRGATVHPSSGVEHPGTYRGLVEKIPYLVDLGVTTVELMPVQEFNEHELDRANPVTGEPLRNYWGYDPVAFLAPKGSYASGSSAGSGRREFREMVRALHAADLEVIVDIVLNHTAERGELGPTLSLRGIDNAIYYVLDPEDPRFYLDYTGCGNTVNANHPVVLEFIIDVLRRWVVDLHVDGFRFDLASVLGRDEKGRILSNPPLLEQIAEDPILRDVKLIAEAWDAGGAYQVGSFAERRWAEWNGRFRDDVRRFWRGDRAMVGVFASRLCGSEDVYEGSGKGPESSVNFVTCHDGFTLNDLVTYQRKHNEANGENNHDGWDANYSTNSGVEGPSDDPAVEAERVRRIKNFLVTLFVSRGVPMLLGGDEFRRTQKGNNNAYCQDDEVSWYDWTLVDRNREVFDFARGMMDLRRRHEVLRREAFYTPDTIRWYGPGGSAPAWDDPELRSVACRIAGGEGPDLWLAFNASSAPVAWDLPPAGKGLAWHRAVDTSRRSPDDLRPPGGEERLEEQGSFTVGPIASAILVAGEPATGE